MAYFMEKMSVRDMRRAMEKTNTVIIPVGVVEQHGYHLPLSTDQDWFEKREKPIDSLYIVETVGQRDDIEVGVMGFPERATRELGEKVCGEIVESLVNYIDMLEANTK